MTESCTCWTIAPSGWDAVEHVVNASCPLHATYTAAEVKVLTEAALRLGRKEAQDECAAMLEERAAQFRGMWGSSTSSILLGMAKTIRSMASQPAPDASSARTDLSVDTDLPQDPQAVREAP